MAKKQMTYEDLVNLIEREKILRTRMDAIIWIVASYGKLTDTDLANIQKACYDDDLIEM